MKILTVLILGFLVFRLEMIHFSQKEIKESLKKVSLDQKMLIKNISSPIKKHQNNKGKNKVGQKKIHQIPIGNSIVMGNPLAPITLIKWTDFQCPYCSQSTLLEQQILQKYPNQVKLVIKNFPLGFHKQAQQTALYTLAAHQQGKYKEMYYEIAKRYKELGSNTNLVFEISESIGINVKKLKKEAKKTKYKQQIRQEMQQLKDTGMRVAVPKFVLNGQELQNRDFNSWSTYIDKLLLEQN